MPSINAAIHEVIAIDMAVADWQSLAAGVRPDIGIILLPAGGNGLAALATALADYGTLDALHIVSHGASGQLHLGDLKLSGDNLAAQAPSLAQIASHLTSTADVLLYGCSVAAGATGQAFIGALSASLGGVDVAASTNTTGAAQLGGDWHLEYGLGHTHVSVAQVADAFMQSAEIVGHAKAPTSWDFLV